MAIQAETALPELRDAHASAHLGAYLRELWNRRTYVRHVAVNELHHRQITNVLGNLWHLLNPALTIGVYYLIFGVLLGVDRGIENFFLFLTVGLFTFQFTQKSTLSGARSIVSNRGIIRAIRFPRAMLPIGSTVTEFLAHTPNLVVMFAIALISGESPHVRWVFIVPLITVQLVFNVGAAMIAARAATHFVDTIQILPFVFRLVLYASGVIFSVDAYVSSDSPTRYLFTLNPVYCFLTLARWSVMGGEFQPVLLLSCSVWTVGLLVGGFLWFRAGEGLYARD